MSTSIELTPEFWREYVRSRPRSRTRKKISAGSRWDKMAKRYHNFAEDEDFIAEQQWIIAKMASRKMLGPEIEIVDIACGPGTHCFAFAEHCRRVTAVDVSEKMIAEVEKRKKAQRVDNLVVRQADFYQFRPRQTFDTVFVSMSPILNELESVDRLLELSRRYLALVYWAGVRDNPLFQRCYKLVFNRDYVWDALDITIIFNYLNALGYSPEISYLHPVWKRCDTLANTLEHIIWHLEFYRDLSSGERSEVERLVAAEADEEGLVTYYTRVRKGALLLDTHAGK